MWLLNTATRRLEFFTHERNIPHGYAILSHTWGDEEVIFDEIHTSVAPTKKGYSKIRFACRQASHDGYSYIWIDTCCIDKRSSAELSEAVNSMFQWYRTADVCYVYLVDFEYDKDSEARTQAGFQNSLWWSRGWTLQELIAPGKVQFYDRYWRYYGDRGGLVDTIYGITRIDVQVLRDRTPLHSTSVAKRMSWAARRSTSREEDQAYSLLGIFDVNMPLLYGEGGVKAFYRLQEEIIRTSTFADHSILAWMPWDSAPKLLAMSAYAGYAETANYQKLLAASPYGFRHSHAIVSWGLPQSETFTLTSRGLRLGLFVQADPRSANNSGSVTAVLNCRYEDERMSYITIWLEKRLRVDEGFVNRPNETVDHIYDRSHRKFRTSRRFNTISSSEVRGDKAAITLASEPFVWPPFENRMYIRHEPELKVTETFPADAFDPQLSMFSLTVSMQRFNAIMNPAYGAIHFEDQGHTEYHFALAIDRLAADNQSQSPRLLVGIFIGDEIGTLNALPTRGAASLIPHVTHIFRGPKASRVQVTAKCVIVSGELFWCIHIGYG